MLGCAMSQNFEIFQVFKLFWGSKLSRKFKSFSRSLIKISEKAFKKAQFKKSSNPKRKSHKKFKSKN
jgi:hypothetical protein